MEDNLRMLDISQEEIKKTLFEMGPSKAPGRDGMHAAFYQHSWDMVWMALCSFLTNFFEFDLLPQVSNDTFITLIPKTSHPKTLT